VAEPKVGTSAIMIMTTIITTHAFDGPKPLYSARRIRPARYDAEHLLSITCDRYERFDTNLFKHVHRLQLRAQWWLHNSSHYYNLIFV
jgi:hypothetical protein